MPEKNITVSKIGVVNDDDISVEFSDGHRALFEPYTQGFGYQVEGLRRFKLFRGDNLICEYVARLYRAGPMENERKIVSITQEYTPKGVAVYWRVASDYVHEEYSEKPFNASKEGPKELWYPWVVIKAGWLDLKQLETDQGNLPLSS